MAYKARIAATITIAVVAITIMTGESEGRELRPSDHGLEYQQSPPPGKKKAPEMLSFFAGAGRSSGLSPSSSFPLPKALNSSDSSWWSGGRSGGGDGGGGGGRDHVRQVLVVASVACGITGVALLVASAFICLFRYKKQKKSSPSSTSLPPPNDNNSK